MFEDEVQFIYPWRKYQQRILDELHDHLEDDHLHIIAPPGSGKTVLGLEVIRQINRPTLIFAPTITIRNQWVQRFKELFLPHGSNEVDYISTDIKRLRFLNVVTYQALHSFMKSEKDEPDEKDRSRMHKKMLFQLRTAGIHTILVDEAHHLRSEWWKSLIYLKKHLEEIRLIALTATPPYGSEVEEWERYIELCGKIDMEIYVPELVANKDLCPHQDYIYISTPTEDEVDLIREHTNNIQSVKHYLYQYEAFQAYLLYHPCLYDPNDNVEEILKDGDYYISILSYLRACGMDFNRRIDDLMKVLTINKRQIPLFTTHYIETLFTGLLFKDPYVNREHETIQTVKGKFQAIGAVNRKRIDLTSSKEMMKTLIQSKSKMKSIKEIVQLESSQLEDSLRMVILTDYIRKEHRFGKEADLTAMKSMGVIPIFDFLRLKTEAVKLGVLCGSYVVIPKASNELLIDCAKKYGIEEELRTKDMAADDHYMEVSIGGTKKDKIVNVITDVFTQGGIHVLIGTKSLLGEGWDAPCINALILATSVGSFMLSNQMRGRAIRKDRSHPSNTSNIWHLMCVDNESGHDKVQHDLETMKRRSLSFVGISHIEPVIENGIERFGLNEDDFSIEAIAHFNNRMIDGAKNREDMRRMWEDAVSNHRDIKVKDQVKIPRANTPKKLVKTLSAKKIVKDLSVGILLATLLIMIKPKEIFSIILGASIALTIGPKIVKQLYMLLRHYKDGSSYKSVVKILMKALVRNGVITTSLDKITIKIAVTNHHLSCSVDGVTKLEEQRFLEALKELLGPINNPRYLLRVCTGGIITKDYSYYQVPDVLGKNKKMAIKLLSLWHRNVSDANLVYTRTVEGRRELIKAKNNMSPIHVYKFAERRKVYKG